MSEGKTVSDIAEALRSRTMADRIDMMRRRAETTRDRIGAKDLCAPGEMDDLLLAEEVLQYLSALSSSGQGEPIINRLRRPRVP